MMMSSATGLPESDVQQQQLPPHTDNVDEELQRIRLALTAVFSQPTAIAPGENHQQWFQQRQLADRYLTSFQSTSVSWMVCDRLLQEGLNDFSPEAAQRHFFAAQTLHTKCRCDVYELPASALPSLRDSLLQHLAQASQAAMHEGRHSSSALTVRLALCISALAVQMDWTTILTDLLQQYNNRSNIVLPILLILPEECTSDRLILHDENARFRMRDHLIQSAPLVFEFLRQLNPGPSPSSLPVPTNHTLEIFHSWIRYVPVRPSALVESPLLQAAVQVLLHPSDTLETAADVVVEVLRMYPSHHHGNEALVQLMIPLLSHLPLERALQHDDEDILRAYCRVVTEMGESYMTLLLSAEHRQAAQLVGWVLQCSSVPNIEVASICLHFWYRLVMDLESIDPYEWRQELIDVYTPQLLGLVDVCVASLMRYPEDVADLPEDSVDDIHRHRFYVSETIEDCCRLLGGQYVLQRINLLLRKAVELAMSAPASNSGESIEWQGLESCLASLSAIHRFVPSDESEVLPLCFQLIPQLPSGIPPLRFTASKVIGKFAYWLSMHSDLLQPLLPYLAQGLSMPECAPAAAISIKELCECSNQGFAIAEPVLHLYQEITAHPERLHLNDELEILEGVCRALSRHIQDTCEDGSSFLTRLVQPIGSRLVVSVGDPNSSPGKIIHDIERLTVVVQYLTLPYPSTAPGGPKLHPVVELMSSSWSMLETATNRFPNHIMLAEKICRLHKHSLRTVGARAYAPILNTLISSLVHSFERTHQSPYLYAASICVTEYGGSPEHTIQLFDMVEAMAGTAFSFLQSVDDLTNRPDVVEEFFYLMQRFISYCPDRLVASPLMISLFKCVVVGMKLDHHGANNGTLKFLESTISYGLALREQNKPDCKASLEQAFSQTGKDIVFNLAQALMGNLPCYNNQVPEILWKLNLLCPGLFAQWLASAFEISNLPERPKKDFMAALDTGLAKDEFTLAARAFQSACERERRLRKKPHRF